MTHCKHRRVGVIVALAALSLAGTVSVVSATSPPSTEPVVDTSLLEELQGTEPMASEPMGTEMMGSQPGAEMAGPAGPLCAAVPADGEGSAAGMADDPVGTAASNNPLLSTLVAAVTAAGLVDTLNGGGPFTVFAPINSAFDKIDPATLEGLLANTDALVGILTYHVLPEQMSAADLVAGGTFTTVNGADLTVAMVGETLVINDGASAVLCAEVSTANATVYLIDTVLTPPPDEEPVDTTEPVVETTEPVVETTETVVSTTETVVETTVPGAVTSEPDDGGQIEFPEGTSEASVEGTTSNQSFDSRFVQGEAGQLLELSVASAEGNVTFDVFAPDGEALADDQTSYSAPLPADGLYAIELGTGADSADYTLNVAITG